IGFPDLLITVEVVSARGTSQHHPRLARCSNSGSTSAAPILRVPPICVSGSWLGAVATLIQQRLWTTSSPNSASRLSPQSHMSKRAPLEDREYMTYYVTPFAGGVCDLQR